MLVDTHCHLGDARFDGDRDAVVARAREAGVAHIVAVADSAPATARAIALAHAFDLSATAGVHPHEAASWNPEVAAAIEAALADPAVVAVGETGLDYHYDHSPRDVQRRVFETQLTLAERHAKPVVIHARDADADVAAILRTWGGGAPAILHSFSSGPAVLEAGRELDAYFSFSGMITFKNWNDDTAVRACPDDRLLLETDAPYLTPHPHRGRRNEPAYVTHVAARAAALRGVSPEWLAQQTTANAARCFGPRVPTASKRES